MPRPPSWRKIETALIEVAREYGFELDENVNTGDKIITNLTVQTNEINLTDFAKQLEERL